MEIRSRTPRPPTIATSGTTYGRVPSTAAGGGNESTRSRTGNAMSVQRPLQQAVQTPAPTPCADSSLHGPRQTNRSGPRPFSTASSF
eukprot:scaffold6279_cov418-Prasinococcus_capsulatus_cf.AAC.2